MEEGEQWGLLTCRYPSVAPQKHFPSVDHSPSRNANRRTDPYFRPMLSSKILFSNQCMKTAIPLLVLPPGDIPAQSILFNPIDLKVPERLSIPKAYHRKGMFTVQCSLEEGFLVFPGTSLTPEGIYPGIVHPVVEEIRVAWLNCHVSNRG